AAPLEVVCSTDGPVMCTARRFGEGDLTGVVQWLASSTNTVQEPEPSVSFPSPGVPVPSRWTQVYIGARLGSEVDASSFAYEMAPGARPILLAPLVGYVYEGETGLAGLSDVKVEIIDGEGNAGLSRTTNVNGFYQMFHVRVGVPFTMRASRLGYVSALASHPGIEVHALGFPDIDTSFQHFHLTKLP
ncbi:MAG TPA: carboxypeptidase-like regulatory domain-containing protein, partial [Vicinamibacterales bacterium]|nr:carboxypeptidase-like regulatory domain-containing protein [Vicinamibacterales bacterium]